MIWQQTVEFFDSRGFKVHINTLDETLHLSEEELCDSTFCFGVLRMIVNNGLLTPMRMMYLHLDLQLVLQHTVEFLHIMLQEGVQRFPSKRLCQFRRA
jgi:hypothetical protein